MVAERVILGVSHRQAGKYPRTRAVPMGQSDMRQMLRSHA